MPSRDSDSPGWSPIEIKLFNSVDVFVHKPAIIKKAEANLIELKQVITKELSQAPHPSPPEADILKGQIVRGENHKGFPFISLDMPQMFSKTQMFTYRTLFWWGHDLIFSLIIKQENYTPLIKNLLQLKEYPEYKDVRLATTPSPWEWEKGSKNFISISEASKKNIMETIESVQYIKLCRFHLLNDPTFPKLNWANTGLNTWKILSKICMD